MNISHYVIPTGVGITNTISRAELAAIVAAIIHGYSHIATGTLTSMHQIKKQLSHPNLHRHHIQGDVFQSIATAIHQSPSPIDFLNVKSHAGIIGNEFADALARESITTNFDVADTSIIAKQLSLSGILFTTPTGLQKNMKNIESYKTTQTQPSHLPQGSGTYPITMTPCKHTCTPSTN
jgi:ribonuclease HI